MINDLGWDSLESRRCNARLTLFYKIVNGLVAVNPNDFLTNGDTRTRSDNHRKFRVRSPIDFISAPRSQFGPTFKGGVKKFGI